MLKLYLIPGRFSVCQLRDGDNVNWDDDFVFLSKTDQELSLVCRERWVPTDSLQTAGGWRAMRVDGKLDFSLTGVLAGITDVLAGAEVSVFALSTYDTDYLLVKEEKLRQASTALESQGYLVH